MSPELVALKSEDIFHRLMTIDEFIHSDTILVYSDIDHEVNTQPIIQYAFELGKKVALPRVNGDEMDFYYIDGFLDIAAGYRDICEPKAYCIKVTDYSNTVMIMPGVAYDYSLNRIGYGGGFYDRYLNSRPNIYKIAIAYELQFVPSIPSDTFDIKPNIIISEDKIYGK